MEHQKRTKTSDAVAKRKKETRAHAQGRHPPGRPKVNGEQVNKKIETKRQEAYVHI